MNTPESQLDRFLSRYTPEIRALAESVLSQVRAQYPEAVQLVYDNYNALVIGFGPSERASDAVLSVALYPRWVNLFFLQGAKLADPHKLLKGSGKQVRRIELKSAKPLETLAIRQLIFTAIEGCPAPSEGSGRLIVKSISAKQRPRRPAGMAE